MGGQVKGIVTGQNLALESTVAVPNATNAADVITSLNKLIAELRTNGLIK